MGPDEIQLSGKPKIKSFVNRAADEILDIEGFRRKTDEAYFRNFVEGMHEAASSGRGWYRARAGEMRDSPELSSFIAWLKEAGYEVKATTDGFILITW